MIAGRRLRVADWVLAHEVDRLDDAVLLPFFERLDAEVRALLDGPA